MPQLRDAPLNTPRLKRSLLALIPVTAALLLVAVVGQLKMNQAINEEMLSVVANGRKETLQQYFQGYASPTAANSYATSPYADNDLAAADGNGIDYSQFDNYGPSPASRSVAPRQTQGAGLNGFLSDDAGDEIIGIPRGSSTAYNIGPNNFPFASTAALQAAQSNIIAQQEALTKYTYAVQSAIATNNAIVTSIQSKLASLVVGKSSTIAVMQAMIDRLKAQNSVLQTKIDKVVASGWPINGKDGKPGRNGRDGTRGPPGIPGKPGAIGPHGPQGLPGLRGIPGLPGAKGAAGRNGHDGHDGHDGKNGKNGANGQVGPRGPSGKDGKNGRDGENGQPGHPGTPGAPGAAGSSSSSHAALTQCKADFFLSRSRGCLRFRLPKSGSLKSGEKLYSKNEKYTFKVQDDCNVVKKNDGNVAGAIGVTLKKDEKGFGHCKFILGGSGRGFMFADGRPRALWRSHDVGNFIWAKNSGQLVMAQNDGKAVGVIIQ